MKAGLPMTTGLHISHAWLWGPCCGILCGSARIGR